MIHGSSSLTVTSELSYLPAIQAFAREFSREMGFDGSDQEKILLAIEEAVTETLGFFMGGIIFLKYSASDGGDRYIFLASYAQWRTACRCLLRQDRSPAVQLFVIWVTCRFMALHRLICRSSSGHLLPV